MDDLTKRQRSFCMSQIRANDTKIEVIFRKLLWKKGIRGYRLPGKNKIVGKPDIYFPRKQIAVFLDGCFWHGCPKCYREPKSGKEYWRNKIKNNRNRDIEVSKKLSEQGIEVIRFWGHEIKENTEKCANKIIHKITNS